MWGGADTPYRKRKFIVQKEQIKHSLVLKTKVKQFLNKRCILGTNAIERKGEKTKASSVFGFVEGGAGKNNTPKIFNSA